MRSPNIGYMPAVDHLRAYAALLIVFYHGLHLYSYQFRFDRPFGIDHWLQPSNPLLAALAEGHTAVALFMVLSGFILTQGAMDDAVDYRRFIRNRLLRTYPLFLVLVFAGIASAPENFTIVAFLRTVFGLANLPGALVTPPFSSLLWTIAIEWQFYVIFPLLVLVLKPAWTQRLLILLALLLVLRCLALAAGANAREISYSNILGRLDQFLIGMWTAWRLRARPLSRTHGAMLAVPSAIAIVAALYAFNRVGGWPTSPNWKIAWPPLEGALWAAFVAGYVACANAAQGAWSRALAWLGEISYSIYLVHFAVIYLMIEYSLPIAFTGRPVPDALLDTALIALPLTVAVSTLTYRAIERPFLRLRGSYHRETAPTPFA